MSGEGSFLDAAWRESRSFSRTGSGLDLGLQRIEAALEAEGHPEDASYTVLVGGTNGKGSTAAFIAGALQAHGRRVGLYTSPHLLDVRERFRIDGAPLSAAKLRRLDEYLGANYRGGGASPELTYFEATTLAAALAFEWAEVDVAIYEVGLGGRLDATNALDPDLSVLTTIGLDHTEFLGESIREIAGEKCGILRPGRPAVVGYQRHADALDEIRRRGEETRLRIAGRDFGTAPESGVLRVGGVNLDVFAEQPNSSVSIANAACGLEAARLVLGADFDGARAATGLQRTVWPGRYDRRTVEPGVLGTGRAIEMLVDAAHNPDAVEALFDQLEHDGVDVRACVVGGMADKELAAMFGRLAGGAPVWGAELDSGRAARGAILESYLPEDVYRSRGPVERVLSEAAREVASAGGGCLLAFGSTYLVGACLRAIGLEVDDLGTYRH